MQIIQLSAEPRAEIAGRHERPRRPPHVQRLSVNDLATAQAFYVDVLSVADETEHFFSLKLPEQTMLVYGKGAAHTPASYTVLNFSITDVESVVDALTAGGVEFLRYEGSGQDDKRSRVGWCPRSRGSQIRPQTSSR